MIAMFSLHHRAKTLCVIAMLILFAITVFLTEISSHTTLIINNKMAQKLFWIAICVCVLVNAGLLVLIRFQYCMNQARGTRIKLRFLLGAGLLMAGFSFTTIPAFTRGIPTLAHYATALHSTMSLTIDHLANHYHSRSCDGGIYPATAHADTSRVCGMPVQEWKRLRSGDHLRLYGKRSDYGFSYSQYTLVINNI